MPLMKSLEGYEVCDEYARNKLGEILYESQSEGTGTIALNKSAKNFNFIEIYFYVNTNNQQYCSSCKIYEPNNKNVSLSAFYTSGSNIYMAVKNVNINGSYINVLNYGTNSATTTKVTNENAITVYCVVGYK